VISGTSRGRNSRKVRATVLDRIALLIVTNHGTFRGWVRTMMSQIDFALGGLDRFVQPAPRQVSRLVFVCLGNINRSALAQAVASHRNVRSISIGLSTSTGTPATSAAVRCAAAFGVDLTHHSATDISDYDFEPGDLLLVMETRHARRLIVRGIAPEAIALLGHWASPHRIHLHDPHKLPDRYFRTCFTLIRSAVNNLVDELTLGGSPCTAHSA